MRGVRRPCWRAGHHGEEQPEAPLAFTFTAALHSGEARAPCSTRRDRAWLQLLALTTSASPARTDRTPGESVTLPRARAGETDEETVAARFR